MLNASQHQRTASCSTCGYSTTEKQNHTLSYGGWTKLNDDQCQRTVKCTSCSYSTTEKQNHIDSNGDGVCDACQAALNMTVTFVRYTGAQETAVVRRGQSVSALAASSRAGYNFSGWYNGSALYNFSQAVLQNLTLTERWTARTDTAYTVEHYQQTVSGDGYLLVDPDRLTGTTDTTATAATKSYIGFHISAGNPQALLSGNINGNGTLVLKVYYDRDKMDISIDLGNGQGSADIPYGGTLPQPEDPIRDGYDFKGWTDGEGNPFDFDAPITGDITLKAEWDARTDTAYIVEHYQQFVSEDGYLMVDTDHLMGTTDTVATAIPKEYAGFHVSESNGNNVFSGNIEGNGTLVLKVYYDRDIMTVQFVDRENVHDTQQLRYGGTATVPTPPTRAGYDFIGWVNGEALYDFDTAVTDDLTLTASWRARSDTPYIVEHYQQFISGDGYLCVDTDRLTGTTDTVATAIPKGYTGFHVSAENENNVLSGYIIADDTLVLKVYYDRNKMDISIDLGNGQGSADIPYGGTLPQPEDPVRPGYDFKGWVDGEGNPFDFDAPITGDITLRAEWDARSDTPYIVEHYQQFVSEDGYLCVDTDHLTGTTDTVATAIPKGYTGFHVSAENENNVLSGYIIADDTLVLKVYYDRDKMDVSIDLGNGQGMADIPYGGTLPQPEDPVRPGYDFKGWTDGEGNPFDFDAPITGDITLKAEWDARSDTEYTVSYYLQTLALDSYEQVSTVTLSGMTDTTATAEVKDFTGFHVSAENENNAFSGNIEGDGTLTLAIYYDRDRMAISLDPKNDNEGALVISDIPYGGKADRPEDPTRPGYIFTGWVKADGSPFDFETPITESIAIYPTWIPRLTEAEKLNGKLPTAWTDDLKLTRAQAVYVLSKINIYINVDVLTSSYDDVTEDTEYAHCITWAENEEIAIGVGDRRFAPEELVTREQVALMLYRAFGNGEELAPITADGISDWAYEGMCWMVQNRLYSAEALNPQGAVTKSELVYLVVMAKKLK